jgi:hypothetical protein
LRRERVERITKRGARTNSAKTPGPVARKAMHALMPIFFKLMNFDKVMGREQRYRIDWDAPVLAGTSGAGTSGRGEEIPRRGEPFAARPQ